MESMSKEALQYLIDDVKRPEIINIDGRPYSTRQIFPVKGPQIGLLNVHTLTGIVDYFKSDIDIDVSKNDLFIHVLDYSDVSLYGDVFGQWKQREIFIRAIMPNGGQFSFGKWMSIEDMIIELQSKFVSDPGVDALISYMTRVEEGAIVGYEDDGISQNTTVKKRIGGAVKENEKVPCRITLAPYRTFIEIDQPKSTFVFRLKQGGQAALFDSDGGQWKIDAVQKIKAWFSEQLPGMVEKNRIIA